MKYRRIGKTELSVSAISLGTWLTLGQQVNEQQSVACLHYALDSGINFLDTADCYGFGRAEEFLGRHIKPYPRDKIILGTKCFFPMSEAANDRGLSKKHLIQSVENSLRRLDTDYIDLMQCHRFDPDVPLAETIETLDQLQKKGFIRYWGISRFSAAQMHKTVTIARQQGWQEPVTQQYFYNILNTEIEADILPACQQLGMSVLAYSPLAQGVLSGKYSPHCVPDSSRAATEQKKTMWDYNAQTLQLTARLQKIALKSDLTLPQLALSWCLRQRAVASVIIGATQVQQIEENISAVNYQLTTSTLEEIHNTLKEEYENH